MWALGGAQRVEELRLALNTIMILPTDTRQLQLVKDEDFPRSIFISVAGIGTLPASEWSATSNLGVSTAFPGDLLQTPVCYGFRHGLTLEDDRSVWSLLDNKGDDLLEEVAALLKDRPELQYCPIVFCAHSLGGLIVKKCIVEALSRQMDFPELTRLMACFIHMAVPHSLSPDRHVWNQHALIVASQRVAKVSRKTTADEALNLSKLCAKYEQVATILPCVVLQETQPVLVKNGLFKTNMTMIVQSDSRGLPSAHRTLDVGATHFDICTRIPFQELRPVVDETVGFARGRIDRESSPSLTRSTLARSTIRANSESGDDGSSAYDTIYTSTGRSSRSTQASTSTSGSGLSASFRSLDFTPQRSDIILPCHMLAENDKDAKFVGRTDVLNQIEQYLLGDRSGDSAPHDLRSFGICGPGGIGKSQVAMEFGRTHTDVFDAIFWLDAEQLTTLLDGFSRIAVALGLIRENSADARDQVLVRELVQGWLANPVRSRSTADTTAQSLARWLLVFDNVESQDTLMEFWPSASSTGAILVTSRDTRATKMGIYPIKQGSMLPPLANEEAADLLLTLAWRKDDADEVVPSQELAQQLGGMPLAVVRMAGVAMAQDLSFTELRQRVEEESTHDDLFELSDHPLASQNNYDYSLSSVWKFEKLQHSTTMLNVISFVDPSSIPEAMITGSFEKIQIPGFPASRMSYQKSTSELQRHSLVKVDKTAKSLSMHRLIQDNARAKLLKDPTTMTAVFRAAVTMVKQFWPYSDNGVRHSTSRWRQCAAIAPHIERLHEHCSKAVPTLRAEWEENIDLADLLVELGWFLLETGLSSEALSFFKLVESRLERMLLSTIAPSDTETLRLRHVLGEVYNSVGGIAEETNDAETAIHYMLKYHEMLGHDPVLPGGTDQRLVVCYYDLALAYAMHGNYGEALVWCAKSTEAASFLRDPMTVKRARSLALVNRGMTYWLMGDNDNALQTLNQALREREELYGPNDRESMITGRILHSLGNVMRSIDESPLSFDYHQRALEHFRETVGDRHHRTGNSCYKVAEHLLEAGMAAEAKPLLDQAVKIFQGRVQLRADLGRVVMLQSEALVQLGEHVAAAGAQKQATELYKSLRGGLIKASVDRSAFDEYVHVWSR
ncbi:hypothetical protein BDZ85DRAFT_254903 [Elsinoe ampelina]|uniref:Uncharacterized protein n=1 Tax=Elsinoe ampelina TaxID=302913 RepID=A0A6A6GR27_9PEZI|nr:hypothetical protein BDZ85DRAFT_254903 [Elsinoe ampelina]